MAYTNQEVVTILRRRRVEELTGHSRSSLYLRIQQGTFTKPVKIGPRASGWPSIEVKALNAARIAGETDEEIRALVVILEAARKKAI